MAGISLTNELKVRPLVVIPAFVLLSELRTMSDVLILNSFYMTAPCTAQTYNVCSACVRGCAR